MPELTRRYIVMTMAMEAPFDPSDPEGVFVLKPWKDPAALRALATYRDHCYPELGRDLDAWIRLIEGGPVVRGDVGRRNEPHAKREAARSARATATRGRGTRKTASVHGKTRTRKAASGRRSAPKRRKRPR